MEVAARELPLVEGQELPRADRRLGETLALALGAVAPDDVVRAAEPCGVVHPASDGLVPGHGGTIHGTASAGPGSIIPRGLGYDGAMILGAAAGRRPSRLRLVAACLLVACAVGGLHVFRPGLLARIDLAVYDRLLAAVPLRPPSDRVAVVEVDERSLAEVGRWPWPRDRVARLLDRLRELGAAAVGLDVIFPEPEAAGRRRRDRRAPRLRSRAGTAPWRRRSGAAPS